MKHDKMYPGYFLAADSEAKFWQKVNFLLLAAYLSLTILGSIYVSLWPNSSQWLGVIIFSLSIASIAALYFVRPESKWYYCRAAAESIKTRSWRWMMRASPYESANQLEQCEKDFLADIRSLLIDKEEKELLSSSKFITSPVITDSMIQIREKGWPERLEEYRERRVRDQLNYYQTTSISHRRNKNISFFALTAITLLAAIFSQRHNLSGGIPSLMTVAGCIFTWLHAKKYQELSTSYSFTAKEISLALHESRNVTSEKELSEFVLDTETAFSREHTQWAARKAD